MPTRPETSWSTKPSSTRAPPGPRGHRQQVGHDRTRVPEQVAPATLAVLPGRPPGDPGEHQAQQRQAIAGSAAEAARRPGSPRLQPTQDQLGRLEAVHPGGQAAKGPQTTSTSVGYSAPAEVPRGTRRPAGTGSRRRKSTAGLPGRQGPAPLPAPRRGRQAPRWRPRCSPAAHAATTAAPVGTDLETAGWLPQSRPCDSARIRTQVCLVRWWSSTAASETVIGRLLAQEPATAARLPRAAARLHGLQPNAPRRQPGR